jgi:hypothetical protein
MPRRWAQASKSEPVKSGPLSQMMNFGSGMVAPIRFKTRATRKPGSEESTSMARHSRVKSSTTLKARSRRPSMSASATKPIDHRSLGAVGGGSTVLSAEASRLRCFRRTARPSWR